MHRTLLPSLFVFLVSISCAAQLGDILKRAENEAQSHSDTSGLSDSKITAGLKEALQVSTSNAVAYTGKPDGFLQNEAIKILLPDKLKTVGRGMRLMGMGAQVDELGVGMNRAAEKATPKAKTIFLTALKNMSFDDARKILTGSDTAATEYFKNASTAELTTAFSPIAGKLHLDKYVVGKTLDGLFYMLGQEERKIRKNPAAQTTNLLKEVFGHK
jgi:Protein of unknown function (DUF4197)